MRKAVLLAAALYLGPFAASAATPVSTHGALKVAGNRIVDQAGKPVALAGVSFFWSNTNWGQEKFYNADAVRTFATDWNVSLVRAAMGVDARGGFLTDADNQGRAETIVDAAIANGIYVIVDWHSHHAEKTPDAAVAFFTALAKKYGDTPNIIYEIYNEPLADITWRDGVKPYAETVVSAIRAVDPDNLIIVGTPTWSQDVDAAALDPISAANITYALHFYAGTHKDSLRTKAQAALDHGLSIFVSEWGAVNADGRGAVAYAETEKWQSFMRVNCLSQVNWAVSDKAEGASLFVAGASPTGPWRDSDLTASGKLVHDLLTQSTPTCD